MVMRSAYLIHCPPARRLHGLMAVMGAALLLLPGAAQAGVPVNADGSPVFDNVHDLMVVGKAFVGIALIFLIPSAIALALNWGAQAAWKAAFKTQPPFDLYSVAAVAVAVLLGAFGVFVIPAFATLFASFGADLPWPTAALLNYGYLLPVMVIVMLALLVALKDNPRREGYFVAMLIGELVLLFFSVISMYSPIFRMSEAVSG